MAGEQQHYVPRFLLKNFTHGQKPKIFAYDKLNGKRFQTNIKNIATENGFYDLWLPEGVLTLEPRLAHLEANASKVIKKLVNEKSLKVLDENEVGILSVLLAVQFIRTKENRIRFEYLGQSLRQKLREMGVTEENIKEATKGPDGVSEEKLFGFQSLFCTKELVPHLLSKVWVLFETTRKDPFFISDNPVTLHNQQRHGPYGNIGFAVKGIEIYLPISTTLCLGLLCPTIAEEFWKAHEKLKMFDQIAPGHLDSVMNKTAAARAFCEGLVNGTAIRIIEENVTMMNSLQVMYSSRFVYCETNSFELVERMLNDNEKYREGLKPTVS